MECFSYKVETRPTEKELLDHVVPKVASRWHELGLKLLTADQVDILRANHPHDAKQCCMAMFMEWLRTNTDASWKQLIKELQSFGVNLPSVAKDLEIKFLGNIKEADKTICEAVMIQPSSENLLCVTVKDEMLRQLIQEHSKLISSLIDLFQETPIESLVRYFNIGNDESVRRDQIQGTEAKDFFNYLTEQQKLKYYAPDLLSNFVAASYHEEATKKIDHYINSSYHTLLKDFNLICESERITKEKVQIYGNKKRLYIKSEAVPLSSQKEAFIRNAMCKCLKFPPNSVLFISPMPGCITLVYKYKMSDNVLQQVLKNVFLVKELLPLANQNITWLRIDNKMELKIPSVKESMEDTVVSWTNIKTKELDKGTRAMSGQITTRERESNLSDQETERGSIPALPPEYIVFQKYYHIIKKMLSGTDISPYLKEAPRHGQEIVTHPTNVYEVILMLILISSDLQVGNTKLFDKVLKLTSSHSNHAFQKFSAAIQYELSGVQNNRGIENLSHDFEILVDNIVKMLDKSADLNTFKLICNNVISSEKSLLFSKKDIEKIHESDSISGVFQCLQSHWRWDSHRLLLTLIRFSNSECALQKLMDFKSKVHCERKLDEFSSYFQAVHNSLSPGYTKMRAIIEKKFSEFTLKECDELDEHLARAFGTITFRPPFYEGLNCTEVTWHIPTECVSELLSKAYQARKLFKMLSVSFFEIDDVVIWKRKWPYLPKKIGDKKGIGKEVRDYAAVWQEKEVIERYETNKQTYAFQWPYLLAKGPHDELFVGNNHVNAKHLVVFDENLQFSRVIGEEFNCFGVICGIAVNTEFIYVSDGENNCIWKIKLGNGEPPTYFGELGEGKGQFRQPAGLLLSQSKLYVCDRQNHRIQVFHKDHQEYLYSFGQLGYDPKPGTMREPVDLAINNDQDELFITCWRSNTVQVFDTDGIFKREITPVAPFLFNRPNGIFLTPDDYLLIASTHHVLIFYMDGTFVSAIEGEYDSKRFCDCIGVVMMKDGKIVIADGRTGTNRLIVF